MKNKKILLAMPRDYSLSNLIIKNLEFLGLEVIYINPEETEDFKYESFNQRLLNLYHKIISGNKNYKIKLRKEYYFKAKYEIINTFEKYDYGLFIRADFFHDDIISYCKSKCDKLVAYHYDGINRNKEIYSKFGFFDSFYVFDKEDLKHNSSFKFITNFYFDFPEESNTKTPFENDFYFLGSHHESRKNEIFKLYKSLRNISNKVKFDIVFDKTQYQKMPEYKTENINCLPKIIAYETYLKNTLNSKIIIDLVINEHKGLSFRVFESLKYKKKLITTNKTVIDYPFYNSNNILILDENNFNQIQSFIEIPYQEIDVQITNTYSFSNWFNNLFDIEHYTKIQ